MLILHHYPFCPHSRFARLVLAEMGLEPEPVEEKPWERRVPFLELNPAGHLPVFVDDNGLVVPGAGVMAEYLDDTRGAELGERRLMPRHPAVRMEVRRLMDWFLGKFHEEVSDYLATEKIYKRFMPTELGGGPPDMNAIRAGAGQYPLSSEIYRLPDRDPKLAGRRSDDLCGSGRGGPSLGAWIISATCHGTRTRQRGSGTPGSSPGRRFAPFWPTGCRHGAGGPLREPRISRSLSKDGEPGHRRKCDTIRIWS